MEKYSVKNVSLLPPKSLHTEIKCFIFGSTKDPVYWKIHIILRNQQNKLVII